MEKVSVYLLLCVMFFPVSASASAGIFTLPHFVAQDEFALGVEPEVILSQGGGVGINLKYTQGISESSNLIGILGAGTGPRGLRVGAAYTFDIFPDTAGQPGIGIAAQALLLQLPLVAALETTALPYIHKSFSVPKSFIEKVEPYLSVPIGIQLSQGNYQVISSLAVGAMFQHNLYIRSVFEFGIGLIRSEAYFSGGVAYYH